MSNWADRAKCAGMNPDLFVLDEGRGRVEPSDRPDRAKALCGWCPVKSECAYDALLHKDVGVVRAGVWLEMRNMSVGKEARGLLFAAAEGREGEVSDAVSA